MKNTSLTRVTILICIASIASVAQEPPPKAEAKAAFDKAHALPFGDKAAADLYRKAIDIDPDYYEAQQAYIMAYPSSLVPTSGTDEEKKKARDKAHKELEDLYEGWAKKHPDKAVYEWALGDLQEYENPDESVGHYKQAIKIDPHYGPAYDMLAIGAEEHGDLELSREYARKGHEAWPDNVTIWRHYLGCYTALGDAADLAKAKDLALEMAEEFPTEGASFLGYIASRSLDQAQARETYELIQQKFSSAASGSTLQPLFNIYMETDRAKALNLANERVKYEPANKEWPLLRDYAKTIAESEKLIEQGKAADAVAALDKIKLPKYGADSSVLDLTRAKALDASGQTSKAYDDLEAVFMKTPSGDEQSELLDLGKKLGKDANAVEADIRGKRSTEAKPGIPFSLTDYATGNPVSLSDYKGRVVLVNFWYPKCGPCRGEFPYIEAALEKYKDQGFAVLAINGQPPQDEWVMPLIKGWKLEFVPLKGTEEIVKAYEVRGFPANFLYGPDERIYPMPSQVRPATLPQFQMQVEALLAESKAGAKAANGVSPSSAPQAQQKSSSAPDPAGSSGGVL